MQTSTPPEPAVSQQPVALRSLAVPSWAEWGEERFRKPKLEWEPTTCFAVSSLLQGTEGGGWQEGAQGPVSKRRLPEVGSCSENAKLCPRSALLCCGALSPPAAARSGRRSLSSAGLLCNTTALRHGECDPTAFHTVVESLRLERTFKIIKSSRKLHSANSTANPHRWAPCPHVF